jgi:hypothetical protein
MVDIGRACVNKQIGKQRFFAISNNEGVVQVHSCLCCMLVFLFLCILPFNH